MILTGKEIERRLGNDIIIEPYVAEQLNPNSYNLRLHNELLIYKDDVLDPKENNETELLIIPEEGLVLEPGQLYLARTLEYTETQGLVPMILGRSSVGRLGITHPGCVYRRQTRYNKIYPVCSRSHAGAGLSNGPAGN